MNIRKIAQLDGFSHINREERNYAAILYATLLKKSNLKKFIEVSKSPFKKIDDESFGVYFEYSFLRDIWFNINDNEVKKQIIKQKLNVSNIDEILNKEVEDIYKYFGITNPSKEHIQSPSNWSISGYNKNFKNNEEFINVCRFKWSFNIKPDLVVHLNNEEAICIELKHESGEGNYPSNADEKKIFKNRNYGKLVKQTELQKYMMEELLGIKTHFLYIVSKGNKSETHLSFSWNYIFKKMNTSFLPRYAKDMLCQIGVESSSFDKWWRKLLKFGSFL